MAIEIVDLPIKNGGSFHSYVKLPEGMTLTHTQTIQSAAQMILSLTSSPDLADSTQGIPSPCSSPLQTTGQTWSKGRQSGKANNKHPILEGYHLVMTNSSPWKDPPIFDG